MKKYISQRSTVLVCHEVRILPRYKLIIQGVTAVAWQNEPDDRRHPHPHTTSRIQGPAAQALCILASFGMYG